MTEAPALELDGVTVTLRKSTPAPMLRGPRDLPDLARYLLTSVAPDSGELVAALAGLRFAFDAGCLCVLGAEQAGKSSLVALLARSLVPSEGVVRVRGVDIHAARGRALAEVRRQVQIILDDPDGGLDPRLPLWRSFALFRSVLSLPDDDGHAALRAVGLDPLVIERRPRDLSRGEVKRAAVARALLANPALLVMDEPTRALDPLERGALAHVLARLAARTALVVATRDVGLARVIATRVAVFSQGELVEIDEADRVFFAPRHDLTRALVNASPLLRARSPSA